MTECLQRGGQAVLWRVVVTGTAARIPAKAQEALRTVAKGAAAGLSVDTVRAGLNSRKAAAERELDTSLARK